MLAIWVLLIACARAEIIQYSNHVVIGGRPEYLVIPKFDSLEVPHWEPGRGRSFIDLSDVKIRLPCNTPGVGLTCRNAVFEVLMFEAPKFGHWMDHWANGEYCCSQEAADAGRCPSSRVNQLITPPSLPGFFLRSTTVKAKETADLTEGGLSRNSITASGQYVMLMAVCDAGAMPVVIDGSMESIDPYGYVPAASFGAMPFNLALSLCYLAVALAWAVLCYWFRDSMISLQGWISAVMLIAMVETTLVYAHYMDWNDYGVPTTAVTVLALLFGCLKRSLSRVLVMLVALGYGVVRPSLGEEMHRVLYLGGSYFVLSFVYSLLTTLSPNTRSVADSDYDMVSLIVFLLAMVDTTFYVWIFSSINNLLTSLAARKQGVKYLLYRNFRTVLLVLLVFTALWAMYSSIIFLNDSGGSNPHWRMKWTVDALWELIYFTVFVAIAVLWAPSGNAQRYAYSIELAQLEDDEDFQGRGKEQEEDGFIDDEFGGKLDDDRDPFQGTGALDPAAAAGKRV